MEYVFKSESMCIARGVNGCRLDWPTVTIYGAVCVLVLFVTKFVVQEWNLRPRNLPPSPPGAWPIFGHLPLLGALPHITMMKWAAEMKSDFFMIRLGSVLAIVVTSPEMARQVLLTHDRVWSSRPRRKISAVHFSYNYKGITFAQYGATWRNLRKIVKLVTATRLDATLHVRQEETQQMIWSIAAQAAAKLRSAVDLKVILGEKMTNEIFRIVLGRRFSVPGWVMDHQQGGADIEEFKRTVDEIQQLKGLFLVGDYVPWLRAFDKGGVEERMKEVQARLDTFLTKVVEEHKTKRRAGPIPDTDMDMVDALLEDPEFSRDLDCVKATVMSVIAAGMDTSSLTVEWGMSELILHSDVTQTLTEELDRVVGKDRLVHETDIPNLPYLQAVVKEVLRLHPPAPLLIPRESLTECVIKGHSIPAGTRLFVHAHAIGRSPATWERPLEFDPGRFMTRPDIDIVGRDFGLLPFGSGRRACPAIALGTVTLQWTMAALVHAFTWSADQELDMTEVFGITTPRASALTLHAVPRLTNPCIYNHAA